MSLHLPQLLEADWPLANWGAVNTLVAVSGGPDSVALLRALHAARTTAPRAGRLIVAHYNHRLRGDEADRDEEFTRRLSESLGLPFERGTPSEGAACRQEGEALGYAGLRSEGSARSARYKFLTRTAQRAGARYVSTAHTRDDQVETVLHRMLRGTGLRGLSGVPRRRQLAPGVTLVRPMLAVTREEVLRYLEELGQPYATDSTNSTAGYTRNRLRNEALPLLRQIAGNGIDSALLRLAEQAGRREGRLETLAEGWRLLVSRPHGRGVAIDRSRLRGLPAPVVRAVARRVWQAAGWPEQSMDAPRWRRLAEALVAASPASFDLPGCIHVRADGDQALLAPIVGDGAA